eukprot:5446649-Pleurochrysis_carterae.AAC.1
MRALLLAARGREATPARVQRVRVRVRTAAEINADGKLRSSRVLLGACRGGRKPPWRPGVGNRDFGGCRAYCS